MAKAAAEKSEEESWSRYTAAYIDMSCGKRAGPKYRQCGAMCSVNASHHQLRQHTHSTTGRQTESWSHL